MITVQPQTTFTYTTSDGTKFADKECAVYHQRYTNVYECLRKQPVVQANIDDHALLALIDVIMRNRDELVAGLTYDLPEEPKLKFPEPGDFFKDFKVQPSDIFAQAEKLMNDPVLADLLGKIISPKK